MLCCHLCLAQDEVARHIPLDAVLINNPDLGEILAFTDKKIFIIEQQCYNDTCKGATDSSYYCFTGWLGVQYGKDTFISSALVNLSYGFDGGSNERQIFFAVHNPWVAIYGKKSEKPLVYNVGFDRSDGSATPMEMTLVGDKIILSGMSPYRDGQREVTTYKMITPTKEVYSQMSTLFR